MNTVYRCFLDYYHSTAADSTAAEAVEKGIAAYLRSIGISPDEETPNAENAAQRELLRFKLMPPKTFAEYFENFETRERIHELVRETEELALNRAARAVTIGQPLYRETLNRLYALGEELMRDRRYASWMEAKLKEAADNLKYAVGASDRIPDKVTERLLFAGQYEK